MKHVGKMKNNGAKIVVAYRTLPGDSGSALVVGTGTLPEAWHDSLMNLVQDVSGHRQMNWQIFYLFVNFQMALQC